MTKLNVTLEELLEAGAHYGHQSKRWNPKMAQYLYGVRDGVHIFDLVKTREALLTALTAITEASKTGKSILIVGTKKPAQTKVKELAEKTGILYVTARWLGGTLTNFDQIIRSVNKLSELQKGLESGEFKHLTKKERLLIERKANDLQKFFGGISGISRLPDLMIIIDTHHEASASREAKMTGIPVVGVLDSNSDPTGIDFPIPMNDDANKALEFVLGLIERALLEGKSNDKNSS